jgi:antitoxin (DNA-binding transcriptional repressor) of toxin-antitoxin stability system
MKTMTVGEFKAQFSSVIEQIKAGEEIAVTYGKQKKVVGYFKPSKSVKKSKRKLGILEGRATAIFRKGFKMTEEEFLGL